MVKKGGSVSEKGLGNQYKSLALSNTTDCPADPVSKCQRPGFNQELQGRLMVDRKFASRKRGVLVLVQSVKNKVSHLFRSLAPDDTTD